MDWHYWNIVANKYDSLYHDVYSALENATVSRIVRKHLKHSNHVLDVGCGTGLGRNLLGEGHLYTGCDPAANMLRLARIRYPECDWYEASAERMPFPDGAFDGAMALFSVWSFVEPTQAARELARVLKPGAPVVLMALNRTALWRVRRPSTVDLYATRGDHRTGSTARFYTRAEFLEALAPRFRGRVVALSWLGNVYQKYPLWSLDRILCFALPQFAHNHIFIGRRDHA